MKLKPLDQQTIVITGGSSGIGLATALMAAKRGAQVVVVSRSEDALARVCAAIQRDGGRADYVVADVGVRDEVRNVVETVVDRHGGFDTWVNNAGAAAYAKLEEISDDDHERMFQTNYWGVVYGSTEALKHLRRHGDALINMGSISSDMPAPILGGYTATKHAVKGFTDSLRLELLHDDAPVSVTLIQPSGMHTPFRQHAKNYMDRASKVPPPVYAPELVAQAVLHAAGHPIRSVIVGGVGRLMTWGARFFPGVTDPVYSEAFFKTAKDPNRAPRPSTGGLHRSGSDGTLYGDQSDPMRRQSIYTTFQTKPWTTVAAVAGMGIAGAALTAYVMRPTRLGSRDDNESTRDRASFPNTNGSARSYRSRAEERVQPMM
jgi:short-subunit dehydrogenase